MSIIEYFTGVVIEQTWQTPSLRKTMKSLDHVSARAL